MLSWLRRRSWKGRSCLMALLLLIGLSSALSAWVLVDLPSLDHLDAGMALPSTRIYDRHGRLLYEILPAGLGRNHELRLSEIPQHCLNAVQSPPKTPTIIVILA